MPRSTRRPTAIRVARLARGLILADAAIATGKSISSISLYERGIVPVPDLVVRRLADRYRVPIAQLLGAEALQLERGRAD